MTDVFTKDKRSEVMSRIRGKGNKDTELALMRILKQKKIWGWRRNQKIIGKPDFVFRKHKVVVFVDGCFWHSCPDHATKPKNNANFWEKKLTANKNRDAFVTETLQQKGWLVIRIWEHELLRPELVAERIKSALSQPVS